MNLPNNVKKKSRIRVEGIDTRVTYDKSEKFKQEYAKWGLAAKTKLASLAPKHSKVVANYNNIDASQGNINYTCITAGITTSNNQDITIVMLENV